MQVIRACNQNCTLFARMSPTFAFVSRFKLAPIFWKKMTAAVQSFIQQLPVHLFLSPGCTLHIYEWGLSHWNNTRRYWRSEAWKEFSPQKSWVLAIDWVRSVIMDVNFLFGTLSPKNTDENWRNHWFEMMKCRKSHPTISAWSCLWIVWWVVISTESAFVQKRMNCRSDFQSQSVCLLWWEMHAPSWTCPFRSNLSSSTDASMHPHLSSSQALNLCFYIPIIKHAHVLPDWMSHQAEMHRCIHIFHLALMLL